YIVSLTFGLSITGATVMLWAAMGVVLTPTAAVKEFQPPAWGVWVGAASIVLCVLGCAFWFQWISADHYYLLARISQAGPARTAYAIKAVKQNPFNDMYRAEVGLAYQDEFMSYQNLAYQAQQQGQDPNAYVAQAQTAFKNAEQSLLDTIAFVPTEYDNYVFLSNLYNNGGQFMDTKYYNDAVKWGEEGTKVEPYGPAVRYQLARALLSLNRRAEAIKHLEFAVKLDPAFEDGALTLSRVYREDGNNKDALRVLNALKAAKPDAAGVNEAIQQIEASSTAPKQAHEPRCVGTDVAHTGRRAATCRLLERP
ncbi:MAG: tetratricopeptide repeat protein, partial [Actinobacteria bacterium]